MSSSSGINWSQVYSGPIGQILTDLSPTFFTGLATQESQTQMTQLKSEQSANQAKIGAWTTLQADAQSFGSALSTLASSSTYNQLQASSSNNNVASAADSSALAGQYTLTVNSVAQAEIDTGSAANLAVTNPSTVLSLSGTAIAGTFGITVGGQSMTVTVPTSGESLNALASAINSQAGSAKVGITANVVQNGSGQYVLEMQATQTNQAIQYQDSQGSLLYDLGLVAQTGTGTQAAANMLQAPSPAQVSFGSSYNSSAAVTSSTNTFANLIPGLTVSANAPGTTTISVTPNISAMQNQVSSFVSAWNQWATDTQSLAEAGTVTAVGSGTAQSFSYQSNANQALTSGVPVATLNQVQQVLASHMTGSGAYQSLGDLGITFSTSGKLIINSSVLDTALQSDPAAVQAVFSGLESALAPSSGLGVLNGFSVGTTSTAGHSIATLTSQNANIANQEALILQKSSAEEQNAILQYGQWVNQVAKYSQQYTLLNAIFNANTGSSNTTGG